MTNENLYFERLIQAVQLLASNYETQVSSFPDFVHVPDEVALIYSDCFLLADQIAECGLLNKPQLIKLRELDNALRKMSSKGNEEVWTCEALKTSPEWQNIRSLASDVLSILERSKQQPDLSWLVYVKE